MNSYVKRIAGYGLLQGVLFVIIITLIGHSINGNSFLKALVTGVVGGILVGVLNSILFYRFAVAKYVLDAVSITTERDEEIQFQPPANYTNEKEPVSGKLFLTNKRVMFKTHKQEPHIREFSIALGELDRCDMFRTFGFIENGLTMHTASNETYSFVVEKGRQWLVRLNATVKDSPTG
ncbi:hypothetical protein EXU57_09065 [Segetibacter sp. 3557_3]|uniref:GRAM domain-containing protein n=1 Tax=Segetibacter sp. 3557_3 TaxID=2547429 RepID=UPI001058FEF6|nr:GRAM domain-containing protein [Segetibacter sp. 3557_3]TDH26944.1 hypothetical protein EXU57_09065 [Segetibacter sp. 3557_3]